MIGGGEEEERTLLEAGYRADGPAAAAAPGPPPVLLQQLPHHAEAAAHAEFFMAEAMRRMRVLEELKRQRRHMRRKFRKRQLKLSAELEQLQQLTLGSNLASRKDLLGLIAQRNIIIAQAMSNLHRQHPLQNSNTPQSPLFNPPPFGTCLTHAGRPRPANRQHLTAATSVSSQDGIMLDVESLTWKRMPDMGQGWRADEAAILQSFLA
eukprot:CAMPEP_0177782232 /NCGR_PEP_ID=MMETSP0491_2-20121128/18330_1 /TAXON_ID=63592 /ORGANISM="Tetraselmis chuii, Strain PLY429" /LENGTH=207 /DNA_ID=CAMNT_0019302463 /DNA_START=497 /DNA_END=1126 /DNA_ORIENTATION=+